MNKVFHRMLLFTASVLPVAAALAVSDGALPIPRLGDVPVAAVASFDGATGIYRYAYTVTNPPGSTGNINRIHLDITSGGQPFGNPDALTIKFARDQIRTFRQMRERETLVGAPNMVPVGIDVPPSWYGSIGAGAFASFNSRDDILPGESRSGFVVRSFTAPTLREMTIIPDWVYVSTSEEGVSEEEERRAREVEEAIRVRVVTLGPSAAWPGSVEQWNQLRDDLGRAIGLGWVSDSGLAQTLTAQLAEARAARDAGDGTLAKARLQALLDTLSASSTAQRRAEIVDLLALNARNFIANLEDTPVPIRFEPKVSVDPIDVTLSLGATYTLTATVVNLTDGNRPIPGFRLRFQLAAGPHAPEDLRAETGAAGTASFSYQGTSIGTDTIDIVVPGEGGGVVGTVRVTWNAAPDLVVPVFSPPVVESQGGNDVFVHDVTGNIGTLQSPPSVTRYYVTDAEFIDLATAPVLGERVVSALPHEELDHGELLTFRIPSDLAAGSLYLAACADDDQQIAELDEANNCSFNSVEGFASVVMPMQRSSNQVPDCSGAAAGAPLLWPPNHKPRTISISGVTDVDNDLLTLRVTAITQDEPINGLGDGDTSPDGFGIGTSQGEARAERSGAGNGRVYRISFTADDGKGGTCTGTVGVGVPHDQGQGSRPIDDGQMYDSTMAP